MRKGFTLIELIISIAIISIFLISVIFLSLQFVEESQKARSFQEVQQNGRFAMERMLQEIRAASDLNTGASTFNTHPGVLSLAVDDATKNPTIFDVSGGQLRIKQGTGSALPLTSTKVQVTNLVFKNFSVANRTKNIKISLTVEHDNPANVPIFDADISLEGAAVIREQED